MSKNNSSENIYVGSGRRVVHNNGEFLAVQLDLTVLRQRMAEIGEFVKKVKFRDGEHELLNLVVAPMREETEYKTHYVKVDKYKPKTEGFRQQRRDDDEIQSKYTKSDDVDQSSEDTGNDDIPF